METPISVTEASQVAETRRHVLAVAQAHGLSEDLKGRAALVVTEAATNIVKYGRGGNVIVRSYAEPCAIGIEILALDNGPGIARLERSMSDGYSSGGSLGFGLGTIARLSSHFEIYTGELRGTAILARIQEERRGGFMPHAAQSVSISGLSIAKAGQVMCGDTWSHRWVDGALWVAAVDGLGHGPQAAHASTEAVRIFHDCANTSTPSDVVGAVHAGLKATRGAVMAVAIIRPVLGTLDFAGVGNISAALLQAGEARRLPSMDGTVGYSVRAIRQQSYPWNPGSMLVLTTDGLSTRWNLAGHPALGARHPSLIASVIHRDFSRSTDDATVVVVKGDEA